jgi:hypothetical protein
VHEPIDLLTKCRYLPYVQAVNDGCHFEKLRHQLPAQTVQSTHVRHAKAVNTFHIGPPKPGLGAPDVTGSDAPVPGWSKKMAPGFFVTVSRTGVSECRRSDTRQEPRAHRLHRRAT